VLHASSVLCNWALSEVGAIMFKSVSVAYDHDINREQIAEYTISARRFLAGLTIAPGRR
jgi:hypothetical protein